MLYRIVETDNFGWDYPNESFVNLSPINSELLADQLCKEINDIFCNYDGAPRYWKVVKDGYKLVGGFEP